MAIATLLIGAIVFGIGIVGQVAVSRRRSRAASAGDRAGARLVLTLAAIIVGAWMLIASTAFLLHGHAHRQSFTVTGEHS